MRHLLLALLLDLASCQRSDPPPPMTSQVSVHELRSELAAMVERDQTARRRTLDGGDEAWRETAAVDRANTARMKQIVAEYGWPGNSLVGRDGANNAWLLIQHADADLPFQKLCLDKLGVAVAAGDADPSHHAYLLDRIAVAEQRPQRFGTQFDNDLEPQPIEDAEHVDKRRAEVGLGTLEEYRAEIVKMYGRK